MSAKIVNPYSQASTHKVLTTSAYDATLEGGTEGSEHDAEASVALSASGVEESPALVAVLDTCLAALVVMLDCAWHPDRSGSRVALDEAYEDLITSLEEFRNAVPKA